MSNSSIKVLVTGGTGFIGLHVVNELLSRGYQVNTTTRSLNDEKIKSLRHLQSQYPNKLNLFAANLEKEGSFFESMKDVDAIFHLATPVLVNKKMNDPHKEQINPAVDGTKNVLLSCLQVPTIKTIIVTSSVSSIFSTNKIFDIKYDEKNTNEFETVESCPYSLAKTRAEDFVWHFEKENPEKYRIATINPGVVYGPLIYPTEFSLNGPEYNVGLGFIKDFLNGEFKTIPRGGRTFVDVRDVAKAHVEAFENEKATGKFILNLDTLTFKEFVDHLRNLTNSTKLPTAIDSGEELKMPFFDNSKSKNILGLEYTSVENSLKDSLAQLVDLKQNL